MRKSRRPNFSDLLSDPVLLRWYLRNRRGRLPAREDSAAAASGWPTIVGTAACGDGFADLAVGAPGEALDLSLAGATITLSPSAPDILFRQRNNWPMLHGFGWLAGQPETPGAEIPGEWVAALWRAWMDRHATARPNDIAWRADVAAARAVNLLDYARRRGLPGPRRQSLAVLADHAPAIAASVAAGADAAVQGHGLYRLGVELGLSEAAKLGLDLLTGEARQRIRPSGMRGDGSTGGHLRLVWAYADSWLAARRHDRPESGVLRAILCRLASVLPVLVLPGGLPDIGEAPAECPAGFLLGVLGGERMAQGWTGRLTDDERGVLAEALAESSLHDLDRLRGDGWLRFDNAGWSGLWHAAGWIDPDGHQDLGSFELHYGGVPIFVDAGTSPPVDGASYATALVHNGLTLDGLEPCPRDRPVYDEAFKRSVAGIAPDLRPEFDGVSLCSHRYDGLGGPREMRRRWRFAEGGFVLDDLINGTGRYRLRRRLITPLEVTAVDGAVVLSSGRLRLSVSAEGPPVLRPLRRWTAAGVEQPLTIIEFGTGRTNLPWRGRITVAGG